MGTWKSCMPAKLADARAPRCYTATNETAPPAAAAGCRSFAATRGVGAVCLGRASPVRFLARRLAGAEARWHGGRDQPHHAGIWRLRGPRTLRHRQGLQRREPEYLRLFAKGVAPELGGHRRTAAHPGRPVEWQKHGAGRAGARLGRRHGPATNHLDAECGRQRATALGIGRREGRLDRGFRRHVYKTLTVEWPLHRSTMSHEAPMTLKIQQLPEMTLVGLNIRTQPQSPEIPALWPKFVSRIPEILNQAEPDVTYGAMWNGEPGTHVMHYMAAVAVTGPIRVLPPGMSALVRPAGSYAAFSYPFSGLAKGF